MDQPSRGGASRTRPTSSVLDALLRLRYPVAAGAAFASAWTFAGIPADITQFAHWASRALHGDFGAVYSDAQNQAGPLQLLGSWLLLSGSSTGRPLTAVVAVVNAALVIAAMRMSRGGSARMDDAALRRRELLVGAMATLWMTLGGMWSGHPVEVLIPLLWFGGMRLLAASRAAWSAVLFGLAMAIAPWAVLVLPATLAVARFRRAVVVSGAAVGVGAAWYLPFVVAGHFRMFAHVWPVASGTLVARFAPHVAHFDWRLRLLQAAIVAGGTAVVALRLRRAPRPAMALAPMTTALLRLLTDPLRFDYYWVPLGVLAVIALAQGSFRRNLLGVDVRLVALAYLAATVVATRFQLLGALVMLALLASVAAGDLRLARLVPSRWPRSAREAS